MTPELRSIAERGPAYYLQDRSSHVSSAYLTFVAVDKQGNHIPVPPVIPETEDQKRRYEGALRRREIRRDEYQRRRRK